MDKPDPKLMLKKLLPENSSSFSIVRIFCCCTVCYTLQTATGYAMMSHQFQRIQPRVEFQVFLDWALNMDLVVMPGSLQFCSSDQIR